MDDKEKMGMVIEQLRWMSREMSEIKSDVKSLLADKWKRAGATIVLGAIAGFMSALLIEVVRAMP